MARVKWVKVEGLRQIEEALMNLKRATAKNVALRDYAVALARLERAIGLDYAPAPAR